MKLLKTIMITIFVLSITLCNAQIKNTKTETVKIAGNCGMCKSTIENAGNKKKQAQVEWNKETKTATISYDSVKTSKNAILKRVALVGYDNELFISPDDTYANLPGCCQYVRAKKEVVSGEKPKMDMKGNHSEHKMTEPIDTPKITTDTAKTDYLKLVFDYYFEVKNALVKSDGNLTSTKAAKLVKSLENVKMDELEMAVHMVWMKVSESLKKQAKAIAGSKDVEKQRSYLNALSQDMFTLLKVAKYKEPVFYQYCPMKDANWLSTENAVKNPYYGAAMLSCGKTVETIK